MPAWTYRPELDGLRSVAVYLVVLFHCGIGPLEGGYVGVDLFFVLSGFLVSHVIWAEVDKHGSFRLGWFYARRVRRLLPAAVLVIIATAAVQLLVASSPQRDGMVRDGQSALVYLSNWQFITDSRDYFAAGTTDTSPFLHFWSLSIEEQFYVVLPLALLLLLRLRRHAVLVVLLLTAVVAGSVALQLWHASTDPTYAYYATETRVYQLAAGVLLAMLTRLVTIPARVGWPLAVVGVAGTVAVASSLIEVSPATRGLLATATSLAAIAGLYAAPTGPAARVLALSVPRYLGQVSYGTYLWHWPVILVTRQLFEVRDLVVLAVAAPVATGPRGAVLRGRRAADPPGSDAGPLPLAGGRRRPGGLVLAAVLVVPPVLQASVRPVVGNPEGADLSALAEQAAWVEDPVPDGLDLVAALDDVPDAGDPCTTADLDVCVREGGAGARVLLVGDSQAAMFVTAFESLAREQGFTFLTNIVRGCGWQAGLVPRCADELTTFYRDVLPALDVDVVVAVSLSRGEPVWQERLADPSRPVGETLSQLHVRTAQETADLVHAAGARLVGVKALLGTNGYRRNGPDPLDCLARADRLGDCAVVTPLERPFTDGVLEAMAAGSPDDTAVVDLNPVLCPDAPICRPVVGRTVVWKDPDHVTGHVSSTSSARPSGHG